jgi:hypothetical protein
MGIKNKGEELYEKLYASVRSTSAQLRRIRQFKKLANPKALSEEQICQVKDFYKPYRIPNMVFHKYFTEKTGVFDVRYIPQDLYVGYIDAHFNDIRAAKYIDNKCYYDMFFHSVPQPVMLAKRMNKIWLNSSNEVITLQQLKEILLQEKTGVFIKEAQTTAGGFGVSFFEQVDEDAWEEILKIVSSIPTDIVIQRKLVQHPKLAELNSASVNSLRIYSVLHKDGNLKIYSAVLRVGVGNTRVDNYASGGISCGIAEDGTLRKYAFNKKGDCMTEHPVSGITLEGFQVPSYDKAVALVQKVHPTIPHFRSVSWDIAIVEDGTPVLIEANLCRGGIDLLQLNNGPLFGDDTEKILAEVFENRR